MVLAVWENNLQSLSVTLQVLLSYMNDKVKSPLFKNRLKLTSLWNLVFLIQENRPVSHISINQFTRLLYTSHPFALPCLACFGSDWMGYNVCECGRWGKRQKSCYTSDYIYGYKP